MIQKTLAIIKPDAVKRKLAGEIIKRLEMNNFEIIGMKLLHLDKETAEGFYAIHKGKEFYEPLIKFMCSGPCIIMVLQSENAIDRYRTLIGPTDHTKAMPGTVRAEFATDVRHNVVHGSDSLETAEWEIKYFFKDNELV
jgi:nucleoside-diphosphate kinase